MLAAVKSRHDLLLLLSLLLAILLHPVLDHGDVRRLFLGGLMFVPVILSTIRLSQIKGWLWQAVLLVAGIVIFAVAGQFWPNPAFATIGWGMMAVYFGLTVVGLFSYVHDAESITSSHLFTAVSIYLLLALLWFALYCAVTSFYPGAILTSQRIIDRQSVLLYFSLATLTTVGYGDVVPVYNEVRMLAVLESVAGVLYVAITVAILVSSYRRRSGA